MKLSTEQLKELRALCNDSTAWASVLDELIAIRELKGDQVPVGFTSERALAEVYCGESSRFGPLDDVGDIPLYDRPQKPVVLPHGHKPYLVRSQTTAPRAAMTANGDWLHRVQVIEAIEAAGGIVKDGE